MLYKYYLTYQHGGGTGSRYIQRESPLDSEEALREVHELLEQEMGRAVVILDWKRID